MLGTYLLAKDHDALRDAQRARSLMHGDFEAAFASGIDVLFTPTTHAPAFAVGAADDPANSDSDALTAPASLAGLPALTLPIGAAGRLPVGGQLIAQRWNESTLFSAAARLERVLRRE
jgi:aspartyl-tRNA(Asn)/glutamyl-tRNA(Gln) amidotransferase subunit A